MIWHQSWSKNSKLNGNNLGQLAQQGYLFFDQSLLKKGDLSVHVKT
jgi:hypothetical protein